MLFTGLGSVRIVIVETYDLELENAALALRPCAAFSRPRSLLFTTVTNVYIHTRIVKQFA